MGLLSTFRSLRELLSGFLYTNRTHILQARKQIECDNKYWEISNLIIITNRMKIIKIRYLFYVRVCVGRKYSYGQFNKKMICSPVCACVHVGKVYRINVSVVGRSKEDKKLTLLTYMCIYIWRTVSMDFCFLKSTSAFFMIFGDNVSRSGSWQKNVACFFTLW